MKPDVLEQMKVLEKERDDMIKEMAKKQGSPIMMNVLVKHQRNYHLNKLFN